MSSDVLDILTEPMEKTDLATFVEFLDRQRDYPLVKGWFYAMYHDYLEEQELEGLLEVEDLT